MTAESKLHVLASVYKAAAVQLNLFRRPFLQRWSSMRAAWRPTCAATTSSTLPAAWTPTASGNRWGCA